MLGRLGDTVTNHRGLTGVQTAGETLSDPDKAHHQRTAALAVVPCRSSSAPQPAQRGPRAGGRRHTSTIRRPTPGYRLQSGRLPIWRVAQPAVSSKAAEPNSPWREYLGPQTEQLAAGVSAASPKLSAS